MPGRIGIDVVASVGSAVILHERRDRLVRLQGEAPPGTTYRRMGDLLGMRVVGPDGTERTERVTDARLLPEVAAEEGIHPRIRALLVGRSRPGSLMGYDRASVNGPRPVAAVLRWLNRHAAQLDWDEIDRIDWDERTVHAATAPRPLHEMCVLAGPNIVVAGATQSGNPASSVHPHRNASGWLRFVVRCKTRTRWGRTGGRASNKRLHLDGY